MTAINPASWYYFNCKKKGQLTLARFYFALYIIKRSLLKLHRLDLFQLRDQNPKPSPFYE